MTLYGKFTYMVRTPVQSSFRQAPQASKATTIGVLEPSVTGALCSAAESVMVTFCTAAPSAGGEATAAVTVGWLDRMATLSGSAVALAFEPTGAV